ncbi:unnamed protein product, partial [Scytosiphon promiscuus]
PLCFCQGTLVVSDCLNHMSIVSGCRAAGAHIRVFKHNDAEDLESVRLSFRRASARSGR